MNKIAKLEKMRYSILTKDLTKCYICGKQKQEIHEIYEGAKRIASMKWGCCLPVCRDCHRKLHNNREFALKYKKLCQIQFEKLYDVDFISIFYKNYK